MKKLIYTLMMLSSSWSFAAPLQNILVPFGGEEGTKMFIEPSLFDGLVTPESNPDLSIEKKNSDLGLVCSLKISKVILQKLSNEKAFRVGGLETKMGSLNGLTSTIDGLVYSSGDYHGWSIWCHKKSEDQDIDTSEVADLFDAKIRFEGPFLNQRVITVEASTLELQNDLVLVSQGTYGFSQIFGDQRAGCHWTTLFGFKNLKDRRIKAGTRLIPNRLVEHRIFDRGTVGSSYHQLQFSPDGSNNSDDRIILTCKGINPRDPTDALRQILGR